MLLNAFFYSDSSTLRKTFLTYVHFYDCNIEIKTDTTIARMKNVSLNKEKMTTGESTSWATIELNQGGCSIEIHTMCS